MNGNGRKENLLVAAETLVEQGQLDKALIEYGRIVAEEPGDTSTWLKMSWPRWVVPNQCAPVGGDSSTSPRASGSYGASIGPKIASNT